MLLLMKTVSSSWGGVGLTFSGEKHAGERDIILLKLYFKEAIAYRKGVRNETIDPVEHGIY